MPAHPSKRPERVFVLRLWREDTAPVERLRCSVDDVKTGQRRAFAGIAALAEFLQASLGSAGEPIER